MSQEAHSPRQLPLMHSVIQNSFVDILPAPDKIF